jgi:hypothetical protein
MINFVLTGTCLFKLYYIYIEINITCTIFIYFKVWLTPWHTDRGKSLWGNDFICIIHKDYYGWVVKVLEFESLNLHVGLNPETDIRFFHMRKLSRNLMEGLWFCSGACLCPNYPFPTKNNNKKSHKTHKKRKKEKKRRSQWGLFLIYTVWKLLILMLHNL